MAPEMTYASSWALQIEASARWDDTKTSAAALDADGELALSCDTKGLLTLWKWPLRDDVQRPSQCEVLATKRSLGAIVPSSLMHVPRRKGCFVAVFEEECEVHAYIGDDEIHNYPLLVLDSRPTATCIHGGLGELISAHPGAVRCHSLRGFVERDVKAPQRLEIKVDKTAVITALCSSDDAGVLIALSAKGDYWCWDAYTGQALAAGARLNGDMKSSELFRAHLHAPSRCFAALERPTPKTAPKSDKEARKVRAATMRRTSTRLWFLDGAHQAEAKTKIDHRNYAPLTSALCDAESEDCCLLLVGDSSGTVRGWHVSQEGAVAVLCARVPQLLPISGDGFMKVFGYKSRVVVCAGKAVICGLTHQPYSERRVEVSDEIVRLQASDDTLITLSKNYLEGDDAAGPLRPVPSAIARTLLKAFGDSEPGWLIGFEDGDLDIITPHSRGRGREPRKLLGRASYVAACTSFLIDNIAGDDQREVFIAAYGNGEICGWSAEIGSQPDFHLPQHGAPILLVEAIGTQVLVLSTDGECRLWDLASILDEDEGDMRFPLVGRFDSGQCGCAVVLEPRKGLVGEIVIGSATGALEVWVLPSEQEESVRNITQTCHASSVTCIASYKSGEAYSLLTASDESIVRWVLDDQGLQARERFPVSRSPSSLVILPPLKGGDPDLYRFVCSYANHSSIITQRRRRDVFGRLGLYAIIPQRPPSPLRQKLPDVDHDQHFTTSNFRGCEVEIGESKSRAVILGGKEASVKPPGTPPPKIEKRVFHKESVKREPQTPNLLITYFGKGREHNPEIPSHIVQCTVDRGPRQAYPAHLENRAVARPGTGLIEEERPITQPCSPAATIVPVAPSDTTGRQLKTVDKPVAPSLPGTSAYRQQILKERKLGPLPADDPRLQPHTKEHVSRHANLMPASSPPKGALDGPIDVSAIEDWAPPSIDEEPLDHDELERRRKLALVYGAEADESAWRPPYITSNVAPNQSCPSATDDKLTSMKFTSSLTDKHAMKGKERARKAMKGIREVRKRPKSPTPVEAEELSLVFRKKKVKPKGWALLKAKKKEAVSLGQMPLGGLEADEIRELMAEKRRKLEEKNNEPIRGIRGRHWGFVFEEGVSDEEYERRRRLAELEARARARHEAELKRLQAEEEEEARRLEAERLRAEAARRAQLEAEEEEAAEPEDPLAAERASLDEYDLGLYEIFNSLLPPNDKKRLLPFPRLMQWPIAANGTALGVDKGTVRDLYKQAHRCKHGGDRGNYRDFIVFARLLDCEFIRSRLGPSVTAISVEQNSCEEVVISEDLPEVSHVVLVKLRVAYQRSTDAEPLAESKDVLRQARRLPEGRCDLQVHVLAALVSDPAPAYEAILADGVVAVDDVVDLEGLEPDKDYVAYAVVTEVPPDETGHKLCRNLQDKAKELLLSKRIAFTTPPLPKVGALAENEIGIGWNDLSPEARQTELNAALKDKLVKAAIEEAGLEVCKPDDWKPIVRERNPAAKKRWDAWEHWWPRSGVVRKEFLEREMAFAATQPSMVEAAAAEGVVPPSKEDFEKAKSDPEAAQRVEKFQKWYSGAVDEDSDEDFEDEEGFDDMFAQEESEEEEEAVPFVRGGRAQAKKEAAHKASFKASSKPNDGVVEVAALKPLPEPVAKVVEAKPETVVVAEPIAETVAPSPKSPSGFEAVSPTRTHTTRVSTPKRKKDAAAKALRVQARLAAAAARLKARTAFLGGRANKVDEVKGKIEEALANYVPPKRKHLRVYVRMIMTMLRMQKGAKEKKIQRAKQEDDLPDPDDIELFADFDEDVVIKKADQMALDSLENREDKGEPTAPVWDSLDTATQRDELRLACLLPDVVGSALEQMIQTPEPEDFETPERLQRVEAFEKWYSTDAEVRNRFFNEYETRRAHEDLDVLDSAENDGIPGLDQCSNAFKRWYGASPMRAVFLAKASENELRKRRLIACRDLPGSTPETNHNEFLILSLPPLAVPARPPPPPIRYQVYPSVSEERWSINEILRWYSADRLQRELDALKKLQADAAKKWTDEKWAREEGKRQRGSRKGMVEEDERSRLMRQALNELEVTYDRVGAFSTVVDAHKAVKDVTQVFYEEDRQVLLTEVEKGFEDDEGLHRTRGVGSGLDNGDEARDREYQKKLEEEERRKKEAEERKARLERARQRRDEARRKKHQDERAARVRANKDEVDRVEALFVEIRKQRAAKKVQDELDRLDAEAAKAVHKAMQRLEAADVANACLRYYAEQAIAPLLELQRLPVAEVVEEEEDEETPSECERRLEEEYIRAEQQRLNDIVYAPFEPRFPDADDMEDEIVLRTVEPLVKKRSRDPQCVSYGELLLRTTPKMVPVLTSIGDRYREKHLGKLPPLSCDTVIDGLRRRRTLALSSGLDALDLVPPSQKRLALTAPPTPSSPTRTRKKLPALPDPAVPLFPTPGPSHKVLRAVAAARRRVADVRKEADTEKRARSSHGLRAYAAFSGEPLGLLGGTMSIARPTSMKDLRPVVLKQDSVATGAEEVAVAAEGK